MVSVMFSAGGPTWGRVVKGGSASGWGSRFTHVADLGEGLTDGQSGEEALLWLHLLSRVRTTEDGNKRPWNPFGPLPTVKINSSILHLFGLF